MGEDVKVRRAARAVLLTPDARVLLMSFAFPWLDHELWITPGGALDEAEDARTALTRELAEETGLHVAQIGPELWTRDHRLTIRAESILQQERYFLVETPHFDPRPHALDPGDETDWFRGFQWWPIHELPDTSDQFAPTQLGTHLRDVLENGPPDHGLEHPVELLGTAVLPDPSEQRPTPKCVLAARARLQTSAGG